MSTWDLDPAHSQIEFAVKHMMVTTVRGQFRKFTVAVDFDEANPERSTVEAHIDASSIDTGMEARDAHLRSATSSMRPSIRSSCSVARTSSRAATAIGSTAI